MEGKKEGMRFVEKEGGSVEWLTAESSAGRLGVLIKVTSSEARGGGDGASSPGDWEGLTAEMSLKERLQHQKRAARKRAMRFLDGWEGPIRAKSFGEETDRRRFGMDSKAGLGRLREGRSHLG